MIALRCDLKRAAAGIVCLVNLIPFNPWPGRLVNAYASARAFVFSTRDACISAAMVEYFALMLSHARRAVLTPPPPPNQSCGLPTRCSTTTTSRLVCAVVVGCGVCSERLLCSELTIYNQVTVRWPRGRDIQVIGAQCSSRDLSSCCRCRAFTFVKNDELLNQNRCLKRVVASTRPFKTDMFLFFRPLVASWLLSRVDRVMRSAPRCTGIARV